MKTLKAILYFQCISVKNELSFKLAEQRPAQFKTSNNKNGRATPNRLNVSIKIRLFHHDDLQSTLSSKTLFSFRHLLRLSVPNDQIFKVKIKRTLA